MSTPVTYTYDWARIRDDYRAYTLSEKKASDATLRGLIGQWAGGYRGSFVGASDVEMREWLAHGFEVPPLEKGAVPVSEAPTPDWTFNDVDGEYDHDLFISGEPEYYLDSQPDDTPAGVRLALGYGFLANVKPEVVAKYGAWVGSAVNALQTRGLDLEVSVEYEGLGRYGGGRGERRRHRIIVSRFGEVNIGTDWSALFSPGSYRHLAFMTYCLAAEDGDERHADSGLGSSVSRHFGVDYEPATRTIRTQTDAQHRGTNFPAEMMTKAFAEAAAKIS